MKKLLLLLVSVILLLSLCACSEANEPYTVKEGWRTLEINPGAGTITHKENVFHYDISGDANRYTLTITYPDGSTYYESYRENSSGTTSVTAGWSDNYSEYRYVPGEALCDALEDELPTPLFTGNPFAGVLFIGLGILYMAKPRVTWWLEIGWLLKGAEPSDFALIAHRIVGVLIVLAGILTCFMS